jgi:hypothetical protein
MCWVCSSYSHAQVSVMIDYYSSEHPVSTPTCLFAPSPPWNHMRLVRFLLRFPRASRHCLLIMHIITTIRFDHRLARRFRARFLFLVLYYVFRNYIDGKVPGSGTSNECLWPTSTRWASSMGLVSLSALTPRDVNFSLGLIHCVTAIYQQGVTYEVLSKGYAAREMIAAMVSRLLLWCPDRLHPAGAFGSLHPSNTNWALKQH